MKISGSIGISIYDEIGWTLVSPNLMEWAECAFGRSSQFGKLSLEINSDCPKSLEFIRLLRSDSDAYPASFWKIAYSVQEIESASMLSIYSNLYIAEMAKPPKGDVLEISATSSLKAPRALGGIRPFGGVLAVNCAIREKLELFSFRGLVFTEVPIRGSIRGSQPIWRIESSVILPESPIPLKQSDGKSFVGDYTLGCHYSSFFREVELAYENSKIDAYQAFDVAVTRERTGNYLGGCFETLVVSQRFRAALKQLQLNGCHFVPVRLLTDGESPVRDPISELLG